MFANTFEDDKELLEMRTKRYKSAISKQFTDLGADMGKVVKGAAIAAGALVVGYAVYAMLSRLTGSKSSDEKSGDNQAALVPVVEKESVIATMIKTAIVSFLLGLAREQLVKYIEAYQKQNDGKLFGSITAKESKRA